MYVCTYVCSFCVYVHFVWFIHVYLCDFLCGFDFLLHYADIDCWCYWSCSVFRLTADVQDFKSSFKLCVSQGLRSGTQIVGGVISLYIISPQMTSVMAVGLPLMIGLGTLMGSGLRKLSRKSQEQVGVLCGGVSCVSHFDEGAGLCEHVGSVTFKNGGMILRYLDQFYVVS